MRLITFISVPWMALVWCGCTAADSTNASAPNNCEGVQCGTGGTGGDPSGTGVGTGSGNAVGSGGSGGTSTGSGGTGGSGSSAGGAGGVGGAPVDPCIALLAALEEAQSAAQECIPGSDMPQCQAFIDGICCSIVVNGNQIAILAYQAALEEAQQANCPCPLPPPLDCQANPTASCIPDGENTGHCVIDPP